MINDVIKITLKINHGISIINGCKSKESFEKTIQVKNIDKPKKYILRGERNVKYYERVLSNKKKSYNFNFISNST